MVWLQVVPQAETLPLAGHANGHGEPPRKRHRSASPDGEAAGHRSQHHRQSRDSLVRDAYPSQTQYHVQQGCRTRLDTCRSFAQASKASSP